MAEAGRFPHAASAAHSNGTVLDVRPVERLVFWQGKVADHQWSYLRSLSNNYRYQVTLVTLGHPESEARAAMGWPNFEEAHIFLCANPDEEAIKKLLSIRPEESLHVFSDAVCDRNVKNVFAYAAKSDVKLALMGGAPLPGKMPLMAKSAEYAMFRRKYGSQIEKVFAIGELGMEWYQNAGFPSESIVPWAQFPTEPTTLPNRDKSNHVFNLFYMGDMTSRQAPEVLFEALKYVNKTNWKLTCIGEGHLTSQCMRIAHEAGFYDKVEFRNKLPYNEAMQVLAHADLAVMPSRHDGWGALVNEALMRGVPAVCTDKCGAKDLLTDPLRGSVVHADDAVSLSKALEHWMTIGPLNPARQREILKYASKFDGSAGAKTFHEAVNYEYAKRQETAWAQPA